MADPLPVPLGDLSAVRDGEMRTFTAGAFDVMVCRVRGTLYALEDVCSHADTPLSDGLLAGYRVVCPLHGAQFDVRTGEQAGPPAWCGVASFPVTEGTDGAVVEVPSERDIGATTNDGPQTQFRTR